MEIENAVVGEWRCVSQALQHAVEVTCVPKVPQAERPRLPPAGCGGLPRNLQIRQEGMKRHECCGSACLIGSHPTWCWCSSSSSDGLEHTCIPMHQQRRRRRRQKQATSQCLSKSLPHRLIYEKSILKKISHSYFFLSPPLPFLHLPPAPPPPPTAPFPSSPLRAKMMRQIGSKSGPKRIYRKRSKSRCSRRKKRKKIDARVEQKPPQRPKERWRSWTERERRKSRLGFEAPKGRERERETRPTLRPTFYP